MTRENPPATECLRVVLKDGSTPRDLKDEGVRLCYRQGWLHSEMLDDKTDEVVCVFPLPDYTLSKAIFVIVYIETRLTL